MIKKIDKGYKEVQIVSSLVVSHKSEVDLEYYLSFLDKHGNDFFEILKAVGLVMKCIYIIISRLISKDKK